MWRLLQEQKMQMNCSDPTISRNQENIKNFKCRNKLNIPEKPFCTATCAKSDPRAHTLNNKEAADRSTFITLFPPNQREINSCNLQTCPQKQKSRTKNDLESNSTVKQLKSRIEMLECQAQSMAAELSDQRCKKDEYKNKIRTLEQYIQENHNLNPNQPQRGIVECPKEKDLIKETNKLRACICKLKSQRESYERKMRLKLLQGEKTNRDLMKKIKSLASKVASTSYLQKCNNDLNKEIQNIQQEKNELTQKLRLLRTKNYGLAAELEDSRTDLLTVQAEIKFKMDSQVNAFESKLSEERIMKEQLRYQITFLERVINEMEMGSEQEREQFREELNNSIGNACSMKLKNMELTNQLGCLQNYVCELQMAKRQLQEKQDRTVVQMSKIMMDMHNELKELQSRLAATAPVQDKEQPGVSYDDKQDLGMELDVTEQEPEVIPTETGAELFADTETKGSIEGMKEGASPSEYQPQSEEDARFTEEKTEESEKLVGEESSSPIIPSSIEAQPTMEGSGNISYSLEDPERAKSVSKESQSVKPEETTSISAEMVRKSEDSAMAENGVTGSTEDVKLSESGTEETAVQAISAEHQTITPEKHQEELSTTDVVTTSVTDREESDYQTSEKEPENTSVVTEVRDSKMSESAIENISSQHAEDQIHVSEVLTNDLPVTGLKQSSGQDTAKTDNSTEVSSTPVEVTNENLSISNITNEERKSETKESTIVDEKAVENEDVPPGNDVSEADTEHVSSAGLEYQEPEKEENLNTSKSEEIEDIHPDTQTNDTIKPTDETRIQTTDTEDGANENDVSGENNLSEKSAPINLTKSTSYIDDNNIKTESSTTPQVVENKEDSSAIINTKVGSETNNNLDGNIGEKEYKDYDDAGTIVQDNGKPEAGSVKLTDTQVAGSEIFNDQSIQGDIDDKLAAMENNDDAENVTTSKTIRSSLDSQEKIETDRTESDKGTEIAGTDKKDDTKEGSDGQESKLSDEEKTKDTKIEDSSASKISAGVSIKPTDETEINDLEKISYDSVLEDEERPRSVRFSDVGVPKTISRRFSSDTRYPKVKSPSLKPCTCKTQCPRKSSSTANEITDETKATVPDSNANIVNSVSTSNSSTNQQILNKSEEKVLNEAISQDILENDKNSANQLSTPTQSNSKPIANSKEMIFISEDDKSPSMQIVNKQTEESNRVSHCHCPETPIEYQQSTSKPTSDRIPVKTTTQNYFKWSSDSPTKTVSEIRKRSLNNEETPGTSRSQPYRRDENSINILFVKNNQGSSKITCRCQYMLDIITLSVENDNNLNKMATSRGPSDACECSSSRRIVDSDSVTSIQYVDGRRCGCNVESTPYQFQSNQVTSIQYDDGGRCECNVVSTPYQFQSNQEPDMAITQTIQTKTYTSDRGGGSVLCETSEDCKCLVSAVLDTVLRLTASLAVLQNKCRTKDRMIQSLADELNGRSLSGVFDNLLTNLALDESAFPTQPYDFDRIRLCEYLKKPTGCESGGSMYSNQKCIPSCPGQQRYSPIEDPRMFQFENKFDTDNALMIPCTASCSKEKGSDDFFLSVCENLCEAPCAKKQQSIEPFQCETTCEAGCSTGGGNRNVPNNIYSSPFEDPRMFQFENKFGTDNVLTIPCTASCSKKKGSDDFFLSVCEAPCAKKQRSIEPFLCETTCEAGCSTVGGNRNVSNNIYSSPKQPRINSRQTIGAYGRKKENSKLKFVSTSTPNSSWTTNSTMPRRKDSRESSVLNATKRYASKEKARKQPTSFPNACYCPQNPNLESSAKVESSSKFQTSGNREFSRKSESNRKIGTNGNGRKSESNRKIEPNGNSEFSRKSESNRKIGTNGNGRKSESNRKIESSENGDFSRKSESNRRIESNENDLVTRKSESNRRIEPNENDLVTRKSESNRRIEPNENDLVTRKSESNRRIESNENDLVTRKSESIRKIESSVNDEFSRKSESNRRIEPNENDLVTRKSESNRRIESNENDLVTRKSESNRKIESSENGDFSRKSESNTGRKSESNTGRKSESNTGRKSESNTGRMSPLAEKDSTQSTESGDYSPFIDCIPKEEVASDNEPRDITVPNYDDNDDYCEDVQTFAGNGTQNIPANLESDPNIPPPFDLEVLHLTSIEALLISWRPPRVQDLHGYEVYMDGVLVKRVSRHRTTALLRGIECSCDVDISVFTITRTGRSLEAATCSVPFIRDQNDLTF